MRLLLQSSWLGLLGDIVVKIVYDIEDRVVNGEKYWSVASWKHTADVKTGVQFSFQNLFNGNKQLCKWLQLS